MAWNFTTQKDGKQAVDSLQSELHAKRKPKRKKHRGSKGNSSPYPVFPVPLCLSFLLSSVDLGLLQLVRIIHVHDFTRYKIIAPMPPSRWPLPVALVPPKGRCTSAPIVGAFDIRDARVQVANGRERLFNLWCRGGGKSVLDAVGDLNRVFEAIAGMMETTGPKISSCAMRIFGSTSVKTVGSMNQPYWWIAISETIAAHINFAPSFLPIST